MATHENDPLVEVYSGTSWQAELIKGLLETNGIRAVLRDESPVSAIMPDTTNPTVVIVNKIDAPLAKKIIEENENK